MMKKKMKKMKRERIGIPKRASNTQSFCKRFHGVDFWESEESLQNAHGERALLQRFHGVDFWESFVKGKSGERERERERGEENLW
jgi:hypothetical protein